MGGTYAEIRDAWLEADRLGFDTAWAARPPPQPERPLEVRGRGLDPARLAPHRGAADPRRPHGDGEHVPPSCRPGEDRDDGGRGVSRAGRGGPGRGLARGRAPPVRAPAAAARRADAPARGGVPDPAGALDRAARHGRGHLLPGAGGLPRAEAGPAAAPAHRHRDQRREGRPPDRRAPRPGVEHVEGHPRGVPAPLGARSTATAARPAATRRPWSAPSSSGPTPSRTARPSWWRSRASSSRRGRPTSSTRARFRTARPAPAGSGRRS